MFERERATGECECGNIVYGPGDLCRACQYARIEERMQRNEERER